VIYCEPCAKQRGWPTGAHTRTVGTCEMCTKYAMLYDVPGRFLPFAIADRSPTGRDKGTLGSVHESGGAEGNRSTNGAA
jgi:hypothetical protein